MEKDSKIYVAGHNGLLGSAIIRKFENEGYRNILTKIHQELDLTHQQEVEDFFKTEKPDYVILAAAKVGGIYANSTYPAQFIYENLSIQTNVIHAAHIFGVKKLLFFGSACSYPRECPQPMKEEYLLSGYLEPTNEAYAVAKIAGIKMCQAYNRQYRTNFICAVLANMYGINDHFDSDNSHVIPALIRKCIDAKRRAQSEITVWGSGNPRREFIFADDVADAALFLMNTYNDSAIINVGFGEDVSIKELVTIIKKAVGYEGKVIFDESKPDGMPQKLLDSSKIENLGWKMKVNLEEGIRRIYNWYKKVVK